MSFQDSGLDPRLLRALSKLGFSKPTAVQAQCIPRVLEGKDVVARARTGSGKTLAYLLPALHKIVTNFSDDKQGWAALILVPTRELCEQVKQEAQAVAQHCGLPLRATALIGEQGPQQRAAIAAAGHLVVSTPGRIAAALRDGHLSSAMLGKQLRSLVLDEADLLLSYGYEEDLQVLAPHIPRACQCMLMSATASDDMERLEKLVLHNPVTLNMVGSGSSTAGDGPAAANGDGGAAATAGPLSEGAGAAEEIAHYYFDCSKEDRLMVVMALLKLGLIRKKALIFVNGVDVGFRLRLFLESFGIRSALLNAELPLNSRSHILKSFNKGLFDYLIATDDVYGAAHDQGEAGGKDGKDGKGSKRKAAAGSSGPPGKRRRKDEEFGVTRGIDFQGVNTIINYDVPSSVRGYVHRVGRTGRAGQSGTAITLLTPADAQLRSDLEAALAPQQKQLQPPAGGGGTQLATGAVDDEDDDFDGADATRGGAEEQVGLQPYTRLTRAALEAIRYRAEDVARSLGRKVVSEARAKELRLELLNSERLKDYFEDHAAERSLLRHDKTLHRTEQPAHLKHIPAYMRDVSTLTGKSAPGNKGRGVPLRRKALKVKSAGAKAHDPLKSIAGGGGFMRATKKGDAHGDELTEMEIKAAALAKKDAKKRAKAAGIPVVPKQNVRKKAAKAKRRR